MEQIKEEVSKKDAAVTMINLIHTFFTRRPESILRLADLWKLMKLEHDDHPTVVYWKERNKIKHGIPVEISTLLEDDVRFKRTSIGRTEVYYQLAK